MPFTRPEARRMTDEVGPRELGDRCFVFYRQMLRTWRGSMRWTTAHQIYQKMKDDIASMSQAVRVISEPEALRDDITAYELAWYVFFIKHVWPHEQLKCTENGEVDF